MFHAFSCENVAAHEAGSCNNHVGGEQVLIVHRIHDPALSVAPVDQLMSLARVTIPAVLNYLFFAAANTAVVYFGKEMTGEKKVGIRGAEDMKIRMLRFLMAEIWPPLLRTDVPDESEESLGPVAEAFGMPIGPSSVRLHMSPVGGSDLHLDESVMVDERAASRKVWQQKSLDSGMQVLLYLKSASDGTKYIKLILANTLKRIHFDIADAREEKYRWDNRMLHIRLLDNLETQKAIDSYETYERYFREACECARKHSAVLERPDQPLVGLTYASGASDVELGVSDTSSFASPLTATTTPRKQRTYRWFDNLERPESTTLDYKSYFSNPAKEIQDRAVKFMCGFLNAIGQGRLIIGVHEMLREKSDGRSTPLNNNKSNATFEEDSPSIVTHNALVDQLVVGVSISDAEFATLQLELSEQLQMCVPPIPPQVVSLEVVDVEMPTKVLTPCSMLLFYDTSVSGWRDAFRQKSNFAIRRLRPFGYSLCPMSTEKLKDDFPQVAAILPRNVTGVQLYAIVPISATSSPTTASDVPPSEESDSSPDSKALDWKIDLMKALDAARGKSIHKLLEVPKVVLPVLRVVEITVDISRCPGPLANYRGKFFNGWPSIPIWNPMTNSISRVDRNYNIFHHRFVKDELVQELLPGPKSQWYRNAQIVSTVFSYCCGVSYSTNTRRSRKLRLVHPSFNAAFEAKLGVPLVDMVQSTPVGVPGFTVTRATIALMQTSFRVSRLPLLPLLLCHVYRILGVLPSPYPFVSVPLSMQPLRVHPRLLTLYYLQDYETMSLRPCIVLDSDDGLLKVVRWCGGAAYLDYVRGVGFAKLGKTALGGRPTGMGPRRKSLRQRSDFALQSPPSSNTADSTASCSSRAGGGLQFSSEMMTPSHSVSDYGVHVTESGLPPIRFTFFHGETEVLWQGQPWTLIQLLQWLRTVAHDLRVRSFDCERSFGFYPDVSNEVCASHYGDDDSMNSSTPPNSTLKYESPTSVYAGSFDCTICRLMMEWNNNNTSYPSYFSSR